MPVHPSRYSTPVAFVACFHGEQLLNAFPSNPVLLSEFRVRGATVLQSSECFDVRTPSTALFLWRNVQVW